MRDRRHPGGPRRRTVLRGLGLVAGAAVTGAVRPGGGRAAAPMRARPIPASGESLPIVGLGTARTFDVPPDGPLADQRGVLKALVDAGGRVVDTSPMYGHAERVVGTVAAELGVTDELFLATKVWTNGEQRGEAQMKRSERRLGVDKLELNQVHNLRDLSTQIDTLKRWREAGRVRYIGVTHYRDAYHDELAALVEREPIDFVQVNYNIAARGAENRLLPAARDNGVATLINEPFETGRLFRMGRGRDLPDLAADLGAETWAQVFLKFILGHPAVTCVIPATSDPAHMRDNAGAGMGPLPDARQRDRLARAVHRA